MFLTTHPGRLLGALALAALLAACGPRPEGSAPGECSDLFDNDGDGLTFIHDGLTGVTVVMDIDFALDELSASLCDLGPEIPCDCSSRFEGTASFVSGRGVQGTFEGTWEQVSTNCGAGDAFQTAVWFDGVSGDAFHTFNWSEDGGTVVRHVVHRDADDTEPIPVEDGPNSQGQWWLDEFGATYDLTTLDASYGEEETGSENMVTITTTYQLDMQFE